MRFRPTRQDLPDKLSRVTSSLPNLNQLAAKVEAAVRAAQIDSQQRDALLDALLEFAQALLDQHEFLDAGTASAEAMRLANELIGDDDELTVELGVAMRCHADALIGLGLTRQIDRALDIYECVTGMMADLARTDAAVELEWARTLLNYGEALRRHGRFAQALPVLEQAIELFADDSGRVRATLARGKTLTELGRTHEGLLASAAAVELARGLDQASLANALDAHANLLRSVGRVEQAIEPAEQAVELITRLAQDDAGGYLLPLAHMTNNLARTYQQGQQFERAVALYEQAVNGFRMLAQARSHHRATLFEVMSNQALALAQLGQLERAHAVALEVVQLTEREPVWWLLPLVTGTWQFLADLAVDLGRPNEALEHLLAAMRLLAKPVAEQLPGARQAMARLGASLRELCEAQGFAVPDDVAAMLDA